MTNQELSVWYIENKRWLDAKARWFISNTTFDYGLHKELVSLTVEYLVYNLEDIDKTKLKEFSFYIMKRMFNMVIVNKRRVVYNCFDETTDEYYREKAEEYDFERDEKEEKLVNIITERAKTKDDLIVIEGLMSGDLALKQGKKVKILLNSDQIQYSLRKLRGLPLEKKKYKATGIPKGRTKKYVGIKATDLQGNTKYYSEIKQVVKDNLTPELVRRCLKGQLKQHKGYTFEYNN